MARCDHSRGNIQQFTEVCLDCGHNIYETDAEYEASLERDIRRLEDELRKSRIDRKQRIKDELEREVNELKNKDDNGNW
jgi:polyhydroxyalkanoate synthesis regulator phasin